MISALISNYRYFWVSPKVIRTPKQSYSSNFTESYLEEMMPSGSELDKIDRFTSQSKEGGSRSYKIGDEEEKTREMRK